MELLAEALAARGYVVTVTREPGGTPLGEGIRDMLLDPRHHGMSAAGRDSALCGRPRPSGARQVIRPALEDGQMVLCDRYIDSSLAYQGYGRGLGTDYILLVNDWGTDGLYPDLTLFLDLDDSVRSTPRGRRARPSRGRGRGVPPARGPRATASSSCSTATASAGWTPPAARPTCRSGSALSSSRNSNCSVTRRRRARIVLRHHRPGDGRLSAHPSARAGRLARVPASPDRPGWARPRPLWLSPRGSPVPTAAAAPAPPAAASRRGSIPTSRSSPRRATSSARRRSPRSTSTPPTGPTRPRPRSTSSWRPTTSTSRRPTPSSRRSRSRRATCTSSW